MNYDPMWRVVDAHRRCADELERTLKEVTGDKPVPEGDVVQRIAQWPLWRVVDAHRRCAEELERTLKEVPGDRSVDDPIHVYHQSAPERDDIYNFSAFKTTLEEARDQLYAMSDREGHTVRRRDSSRCRVFAGQCDQAITELWKWANR